MRPDGRLAQKTALKFAVGVCSRAESAPDQGFRDSELRYCYSLCSFQ